MVEVNFDVRVLMRTIPQVRVIRISTSAADWIALALRWLWRREATGSRWSVGHDKLFEGMFASFTSSITRR